MNPEALKYWEGAKGEAFGKKLSGYVRVMFTEEADYMLSVGKSLSDEWFEVWDGLLPPIIYYLIASNKGKLDKYKRVLFVTSQSVKDKGITLLCRHPAYSKYNPAIQFNNITFKGMLPEQVTDLSKLVTERIQRLNPEEISHTNGQWAYAEIALQSVL